MILFDYTSGRWMSAEIAFHYYLWSPSTPREVGDALTFRELKRLAAASIHQRNGRCCPKFEKLAEGGFNRAFIVTMAFSLWLLDSVNQPNWHRSTSSRNLSAAGTWETSVWLVGNDRGSPLFLKLWSWSPESLLCGFQRVGSLYYRGDLQGETARIAVPTADHLSGENNFCIGPDTTIYSDYGSASDSHYRLSAVHASSRVITILSLLSAMNRPDMEAIGVSTEGWVRLELYEEVKQHEMKLKADALGAAETKEERARTREHWIFDDYCEEDYL
ncbi:hypothetical protein TEQG_05984 [Trichophyton equinum CBS 127.97]|uniref:Uncharacterized protein n=1 Tax=Trichophyton equinum (strain ATCC MYA-4606 / CBS 127.97) TaxID=559882 RepID=F2PYG3_TRIEC|nr:hypothetical protein TEQG_05984 [Trichophyton equinum CBS 127.97]